ncbi:hypothetical protein [Bacillus suaedae]|uniref:Uncharacterized protein n=1 Tax=Halalkalibacter suaedae TaxID=2822140 RepID=A0A941ASY3_9BACI|nr:hypothetical protein [Bacillus suaedae]MBP3950309.1 hypothetical protein [Bacillus suaedae]
MNQNQLQVVDQQSYIAKVQVTPQQALEAYRSLKDITREVLVKDTDYGVIPGTPKPSLFKPGAENLLRFYGLGHKTQLTEQVKDWDNGFFYFSYKVTVHRTSETGIEFILSESEGSANSKEKRYKNQDPFMLVNTLQKMAIKRALVGATLQATGASGLFTQDIEDMDIVTPQSQGSNNNRNSNRSTDSKSNNMNGQATENQVKAIYGGGKRKGLENDDVKALVKKLHQVDSLNSLTKQQASDMITLMNQSTGEELIGMIGNQSEEKEMKDPFADVGQFEDFNPDDLPFDK